MGCPWDGTHGMDRNERLRVGCPMEGHYDQWGKWTVKILNRCPIKRMSLGCPSDWWGEF